MPCTTFCKGSVKFFADLLYLKGDICYEIYADILEATSIDSLHIIIEKEIRGEYNVYRGGKKDTGEVILSGEE